MRDQRGQLGGLEGLAFGVLVFVIGMLIVINAWAVVDTKLAASAAAREAARAFVEAPDAAAADRDAAEAAADAIRGYGRAAERMELRRSDGAYRRCTRVTFTAQYPVRLGAVPLINRAALTFVASARHSELIDPFRAGLPGEAHCAE